MFPDKKNLLKDKILNAVFLVFVVAIPFFIWSGIEKNKIVPIPPEAVNIEFPLSGGDFYVLQSGPGDDLLGGVHTSPDEKYALDIVKYDTSPDILGTGSTSLESDPSFGVPVSSPCRGKVVWAQNDMPDMPIGQKSGAGSNSVTIDCGGFNVVMAHFKQHSVIVKTGDQVAAGDPIALVGNSGNTTRPHLHIVAFRENSDGSGKTPLPITFSGRYLQKGDTVSR